MGWESFVVRSVAPQDLPTRGLIAQDARRGPLDSASWVSPFAAATNSARQRAKAGLEGSRPDAVSNTRTRTRTRTRYVKEIESELRS
ncbi:hypothetical protein MMC29_008094, partial [Sticta canariensis]|nr:hypothetical protein [Sticta canariensis]